jgi:SPOR domain
VSGLQTPPSSGETTPPAQPAERRCPRCGSAMSADQEWCLSCGAAATTEVAEPRGWRVPIVLTAALLALAIIGIVLAIVALSGGSEKLDTPTPTPTPAAPTPVAPTPTPVPTTAPSITPDPNASVTPDPNASITPDPNASVTPDPNASVTPDPNATTTPVPTTTPEATTTPDTGTSSGDSFGGFPGWPGGSGWTVIIESAGTPSKAESVATKAQSSGQTVGILKSDDYSSLNPGYYVVFTSKHSSRKAAQDELNGLVSDYPDAYVRQVSP